VDLSFPTFDSLDGSFGPASTTGDWLLFGGDDNINSSGAAQAIDWTSFSGLPAPENSPFSLGGALSDEDVNAISKSCNLNTSPPFEFLQSEPDVSPADSSEHTLFSPAMPTDPGPAPSNPRKRSPPVDPVTALKRQRNNVAARKYRQKRIDRITELETELDEMKTERDDLRIRLARQEAETAALRSMLQMKSGSSAKGQ
jgi:hypothetical protein